jgi:isoleucyl-tRNA synthetase
VGAEELYKKKLLYKSVSIQPYSPAAGTGLSSHELNQPGTYKDVKDTTVVAMFKLMEVDHHLQSAFGSTGKADQCKHLPKPGPDPGEGKRAVDVHFLAWTTTPWTLTQQLRPDRRRLI